MCIHFSLFAVVAYIYKPTNSGFSETKLVAPLKEEPGSTPLI